MPLCWAGSQRIFVYCCVEIAGATMLKNFLCSNCALKCSEGNKGQSFTGNLSSQSWEIVELSKLYGSST